jgi:hypothetical protein
MPLARYLYGLISIALLAASSVNFALTYSGAESVPRALFENP